MYTTSTAGLCGDVGPKEWTRSRVAPRYFGREVFTFGVDRISQITFNYRLCAIYFFLIDPFMNLILESPKTIIGDYYHIHQVHNYICLVIKDYLIRFISVMLTLGAQLSC